MITRMSLSLSLSYFVAVTERSIIQVNGQGANTWKTPKAEKEWLWSNVLSSHVITPDSWKADRVAEWTRGERGGVTDMGEREAGERKFPILFVDWTSGDFEGKKRKGRKIGSLFSILCVGLSAARDTHRSSHSFGQRNEFTPLLTFTPISVRQTIRPIPLSHARSRKSRNRGLWPPTSPFDRNLSWKEALTDLIRRRSLITSVPRSNVVK